MMMAKLHSTNVQQSTGWRQKGCQKPAVQHKTTDLRVISRKISAETRGLKQNYLSEIS